MAQTPWTEEALVQGDVRIFGWVLQREAPDSPASLLAVQKSAKGEIRQGEWIGEIVFDLHEERKKGAELEWIFEAIPADQAAGILPAHGRYLLGKASGSIENIAEDHKALREARLPEVAIAETGIPGGPAVIPTSWNVKPSDAAQVTEDWQAHREFQFQTCLESSLEGGPVAPGTKFSVQWVEDGKTGTPRTVPTDLEGKGCVDWRQDLEFPYAANEKYIAGKIRIEGRSDALRGFAKEIPVAINPWAKSSVFWNTARLGAPRENPCKNPPHLVATQIEIEKAANLGYRIDEYLQLIVKRPVSIFAKVQLMRDYTFENGPHPEDLPPGLKLQLGADLRTRDTDPRFLSGYQSHGTLVAGYKLRFEGMFPYSFTDSHYIEGSVGLGAEIRSTGARVAPAPALVVGKVVGMGLDADSHSINLTPDENLTLFPPLASNGELEVRGIKDLKIPQGRAFYVKNLWNKKPLDMLEANLMSALPKGARVKKSIQSPDSAPEYEPGKDYPPLARPEPINFLQVRQAIEPYCPEKVCGGTPLKFYSLHTLTVIEKAAPDVLSSEAFHGGSQLSATFFNELKVAGTNVYGKSSRETSQIGMNSRAGYDRSGSGYIPYQATYSLDHQTYENEEAILSHDERAGYRGSNQINLTHKTLNVDFHARVRSCRILRPLPDQALTNKLPLVIQCSEPAWRRLTETWYSISDAEALKGSGITDKESTKPQGWHKLIRGKDAFPIFDRRISDGIRAIGLKKIESFHDGIDEFMEGVMSNSLSKSPLHSDGGIFPGTWDFQEYSSLNWRDAEITRLADRCSESAVKKGANAWKAARYCQCMYTHAARRWSIREFAGSAAKTEEYLKVLNTDGTHTSCVNLAKETEIPAEEVKP